MVRTIYLFPDVFNDLLTSKRYGTGEFFNKAQIDKDSFDEAAEWTKDRNTSLTVLSLKIKPA